MSSPRLRHDCAFACARVLLDTVSPCLRPEEQNEAFGIFYEAVKACLQRYDESRQAEAARLKPSAN